MISVYPNLSSLQTLVLEHLLKEAPLNSRKTPAAASLARYHLTKALEYARRDGPPHCYKTAFDEAQRLLSIL